MATLQGYGSLYELLKHSKQDATMGLCAETAAKTPMLDATAGTREDFSLSQEVALSEYNVGNQLYITDNEEYNNSISVAFTDEDLPALSETDTLTFPKPKVVTTKSVKNKMMDISVSTALTDKSLKNPGRYELPTNARGLMGIQDRILLTQTMNCIYQIKNKMEYILLNGKPFFAQNTNDKPITMGIKHLIYTYQGSAPGDVLAPTVYDANGEDLSITMLNDFLIQMGDAGARLDDNAYIAYCSRVTMSRLGDLFFGLGNTKEIDSSFVGGYRIYKFITSICDFEVTYSPWLHNDEIIFVKKNERGLVAQPWDTGELLIRKTMLGREEIQGAGKKIIFECSFGTTFGLGNQHGILKNFKLKGVTPKNAKLTLRENKYGGAYEPTSKSADELTLDSVKSTKK